MNTPRRLHLLASGDLAAWPDLSRDLERRCDAANAAQALTLLHAQGHVVEAAQWLARVTDTDTLQTLRASLRAQAEGWEVGGLRALMLDLLSGTFRLIPAGSFVMGSPEDEENRKADETQHPVEITQPFLLKTTPVTQAEWQAVMGDNPSGFQGDALRRGMTWASRGMSRYNPSGFQGDDLCPVECLSWEDAVRFCDALSAQTKGTYRLPTEAEWEYACRAGTTDARYGDLDAVAWYLYSPGGGTRPVGQKQPNAWGLYDMLGNVDEWCQNWYDAYPLTRQRDPAGPRSGDFRVMRGGAWSYDAQYCRAAQRNGRSPLDWDCDIGFRSARSLR